MPKLFIVDRDSLMGGEYSCKIRIGKIRDSISQARTDLFELGKGDSLETLNEAEEMVLKLPDKCEFERERVASEIKSIRDAILQVRDGGDANMIGYAMDKMDSLFYNFPLSDKKQETIFNFYSHFRNINSLLDECDREAIVRLDWLVSNIMILQEDFKLDLSNEGEMVTDMIKMVTDDQFELAREALGKLKNQIEYKIK